MKSVCLSFLFGIFFGLEVPYYRGDGMKRKFAQIKIWRFLIILLGALIFFGNTGFAETVTLQWEANTEPDLAGYKLYYKIDTTGGEPYNGTGILKDGHTANSPIDVGNVTEVTLDFQSGQHYILTVTAYDNETPSLESAYSNEVEFDSAVESYTVTFLSEGQGHFLGTTSQTVNHGANCTSITAIPDPNYHLVNWTGGGFTTTSNPLTVKNVTSNMTITANFAINTYSVTFTTESHGSLTGITTQTVNHGSNCSLVRAVPEEYYRFTGWHGDYTGTENPLTIMGVTEDMSIIASYERVDDDMDGVDTIGEMGPDGNNTSYDGNNDGIPDSQQDDVASFYINLGVYRTLELSFIDDDDIEWDTRLEIIRNPDTYVIENYFPENFEGESVIYSGGFYSFIAYCEDIQIACGNGNFTPEVKIFFHEVLPPLGPGKSEVATWCDDSDQCYDFEYSDITGIGMLFPNRDGSDSIGVIKLKDGERGDGDGSKNGIIEY